MKTRARMNSCRSREALTGGKATCRRLRSACSRSRTFPLTTPDTLRVSWRLDCHYFLQPSTPGLTRSNFDLLVVVVYASSLSTYLLLTEAGVLSQLDHEKPVRRKRPAGISPEAQGRHSTKRRLVRIVVRERPTQRCFITATNFHHVSRPNATFTVGIESSQSGKCRVPSLFRRAGIG